MAEGINRLYGDLAWLWPMWGDADGEYTDWCDFVTKLIRQHARRKCTSILNLGCGGGKNAYNLKRDFAVTGVDISNQMLELAARLNPECRFVNDDMRTCRLGQAFDAVLVDDSVSYMLTHEDLIATFRTAYANLEPGGVMITAPDNTTEFFDKNLVRTSFASSKSTPPGLDVVFIETHYDPDAGDTTYDGTMVYLIRENGRQRVEVDRHTLGLFSLHDWRAALRTAGFEIAECEYPEAGNVPKVFACVKPLAC